MNRWFDKFPFLSKYMPGKVILSMFLCIFSITLCLIKGTTNASILCVIAMLFSFVGDYILNGFKKVKTDQETSLICGACAFIIAHYFYFFAYYSKIKEHCFRLYNNGTWLMFAILLIISILFFAKTKGHKRAILFWLFLAYIWLTGFNYLTISSYSYSIKSIESLAIVGGLSFLASDVIIGLEKNLGLKSKIARELVWWLYPIGQILIITMA